MIKNSTIEKPQWTKFDNNTNSIEIEIEKEKKQEILIFIQNENFTTKELERKIQEIKHDKTRKDLENYLKIIKGFEIKIISYLERKGLINESKKLNLIKFNFVGFDFEGIEMKLLELMEGFFLNRGSIQNELLKIDDENGEYSLKIEINKDNEKDDFYIKNVTIEKK